MAATEAARLSAGATQRVKYSDRQDDSWSVLALTAPSSGLALV
jgi:hypothetical protein